jgi:type VI secretion system protein ImpC
MPEMRAQDQPQSTYDAAAAEVSLLDKIVDQGRLGRDPAAKERGKELVRNFVTEVLKGTVTIGADTEAMINARIAQIDELISVQ